MLEAYLVAFMAFFATIGPPDVAVLFAGLTAHASPPNAAAPPSAAPLSPAASCWLFAAFGQSILHMFGISLAALRASGGILLLLIAIDLVFARHSGATSTTDEENVEAKTRTDISVFPIATPLIAGPGAMGASILLVAAAANDGDYMKVAITVAALLSVLALTLFLMLAATAVNRLLGRHRRAGAVAHLRRAAGGARRAVHLRRHQAQRFGGLENNP